MPLARCRPTGKIESLLASEDRLERKTHARHYRATSWELIATADAGTYPDEVVIAVWEELAARGVIVEFIEQPALGETPSENLVTVATFRNYVQAQFAQTRLLTSGMQAFLFDDNTIRINWFWATALGFVKLRVPAADTVEAMEILRLDTADLAAPS